jgi:hypothetical protein
MTPTADGALPAPTFERRYRIRLEGERVGWEGCALGVIIAVLFPLAMYLAAGPALFVSPAFLMAPFVSLIGGLIAISAYPLMEGYIRVSGGSIIFRTDQIIPRYWYLSKSFSLTSKLYITYCKRFELMDFKQGKEHGALHLNGLPGSELKKLLYLVGENDNVELTIDESALLDPRVHRYQKGEFERTH